MTMAKKIKNADDVTVIVGSKDENIYLRSCLYIFKKSKTCAIVARYKSMMKAINIYYKVTEMLDLAGKKYTHLINLVESDPFKGKDGKMRTSHELLITVMVNGAEKEGPI